MPIRSVFQIAENASHVCSCTGAISGVAPALRITTDGETSRNTDAATLRIRRVAGDRRDA